MAVDFFDYPTCRSGACSRDVDELGESETPPNWLGCLDSIDGSEFLNEARPFVMPSRRVDCLNSGVFLVSVLACLMLVSALLLVWFALVPRDDASAACDGSASADDVRVQVEQGVQDALGV